MVAPLAVMHGVPSIVQEERSDERSLLERKEVRNTGEKRSSVRMGSV